MDIDTYKYKYSWPFMSVGSVSMDSTECVLKIFGENVLSTLNMYRLLKSYSLNNITTIYLAFILY